ncbi:hypothetical protein [Nocardia abscessus]|uniref:hypothetical protein n=1 Tax=Nocardia abscessus TaxID=120957 RepID=UPI002457CC57|nr:hypothetical protein [Nocardia abscessus]
MGDGPAEILEATDVWYYSRGDETAFFEWLDRIPSVRSYGGRLSTLAIVVETQVDDDSLRELQALFCRYRIDLAQLRQLGNDQIGPWFRDPQKYWHGPIFGTSSREYRSCRRFHEFLAAGECGDRVEQCGRPWRS